MNKQMSIAAAVLTSGLVAAGIGGALAASQNANMDNAEMQALMASKMTIADAVKAAEAAQPGKASEVDFDSNKGMASFEVSVIAADGTEHEVTVDANSGKVLKVTAAESKTGDDDNDDDEDNN